MSDDQVATDISLFVVGRVTDAGADMVIAGLRDVEFEFVIAVSFPCFAAKCFVFFLCGGKLQAMQPSNRKRMYIQSLFFILRSVVIVRF